MYTNAASAEELRDSYYADAANIDRYISRLKEQSAERPDPKILSDLESRIAALREERRELSAIADKLAREAAPAPPSPSYSRRSRS